MSSIEQRQLVQRERQNVQINAYNDEATTRQAPLQVGLPPADLAALTLSNATITAVSADGTIVGAIQNKGVGSTLSVVNNTRWAINGTNLVKGATASTAGSLSVTVRESSADSLTPVRETTLTITVT